MHQEPRIPKLPHRYERYRSEAFQLSILTHKKDIQRDMITATAAIAGLASCLFGFVTNLPVALA